jgi:hypothetical protein
MRIRTLAALILIVVLTTLRPCRADNRYTSPTRHFSMQIPDGWTPENVPGSSSSAGNSPVQVSTLAVFGSPDGQEALIIQFIDEKGSLSAFADKSRDEIREKMLSGATVQIESEHDRVVCDLPVGRYRVLAFCYPGSEGIVQLNYTEKGGAFDLHQPEFQTSANTFQYESGYGYSNNKLWLAAGLGIVVLGGGLGAVLVMANKNSRTRKFPRPLSTGGSFAPPTGGLPVDDSDKWNIR